MRIKIFIILFVLLALASVGTETRTFAETHATINVTTNQDEYDTSGAGAGCSLREAIQAANTDKAFGGCPAGSGKDKIVLQDGLYVFERAGDEDANAQGDLDILTPMVIVGKGMTATTIDANSFDRVFTVFADGVKISKMKITGGAYNTNGGGILTYKKLTLQKVHVFENRTNGAGGGIAVVAPNGSLTLKNSKLEENESEGHAGGIYNGNTTTIVNSLLYRNRTLSNNTPGGGITNDGELKIVNSALSSNHAKGNGGGIWNRGPLTLIGSTLYGNNNYGHGGAIYNSDAMVLVNSTLSGNTTYGSGGAISNQGTATAKLYNVTIARNYADFNSDNAGFGGGIHNPSCANNCNSVELYNSLLSNNKRAIGNSDDDTQGYFDFGAGSYNLIKAPGGQYVGNVGNLVLGQDANIAVLADNGGATQTHALQSGSPAIDKGDPTGCRDQNGAQLLSDQRGLPSPNDSDGMNGPRCDLGAFEAPMSGNCIAKPSKPVITQPAPNSEITANQVTLKWNGSNCAETIGILIKQNNKNGPVMVDAQDLRVTEYQTPKMKKGKDYFARIKACNAFGCINSVWSKFRLVKN